MAKVFTITSGLENMGALRTGGQGSVYKGRRMGEIITAVKLLPTPIYSESEEDKNFRDFQNEVQKLKRVNEEPNPNVVKILSSGLSETGNFPFIEMEYIEGPDLEDLLKPPHESIFSIKEIIKVAEQLSNALSHCHKQDVKHGDVKSNNVKYNVHSGNYVLLDFGLAIMSDEQRRTSLRRAGAVEFMAPEQNEGQMLFQTDVYSFGVVIFELLAGVVPFPLEDKGETARNITRLAHLETIPPDVISLRRERLPQSWTAEKKEREMHVPEWMITLIYKCLRKKPADRFSNGMELQEFIVHNSIYYAANLNYSQPTLVQGQSENLQRERSNLQQQIVHYREQLSEKEKELMELKAVLNSREMEVQNLKGRTIDGEDVTPRPGVSKTAFFMLILLTLGLAVYAAFSLLKNSGKDKQEVAADNTPAQPSSDTQATVIPEPVKKPPRKKDSLALKAHVLDSIKRENARNRASGDSNQTASNGDNQNADNNSGDANQQGSQNETSPSGKYTVPSKAYFYNSPDETTRRNAFITQWDKALLTPTDDMNGFVYVVFTNAQGQTSRGWLMKKDLKALK